MLKDLFRFKETQESYMKIISNFLFLEYFLSLPSLFRYYHSYSEYRERYPHTGPGMQMQLHIKWVKYFMSLPFEIFTKWFKSLTFVGRCKAVFTLAAVVKCPLRSSSWLDVSRSEVVITTIPSYAELFKSFSISRAHGNLKLNQQLFSQGLKSIWIKA